MKTVGYLFGVGMFLLVLTWVSWAITGGSAYIPIAEDFGFTPLPLDTDSLHYPIHDRYGDPVSDPNKKNPMDLKDPSNISTKVEYNHEENQYDIVEKMGTLDYRPPTYMTFDEYVASRYKKSTHDYWLERAGAEDKQKRGPLVPPIRVPSKAFKSIFGSDIIEIRPQGSAELIFALNVATNSNPNLTVDQQTVSTFDFKEKIQLNVTANIGDKMKLATNYNTEATFDFENKMKLQYQGHEDEIIKNIEAGDVSLPLNGTLITGSQSLFGIKTSLQFGALTVTSVFSQQRGKSSSITVQGGAQTTQFDIKADQYEANKHYFLAQYFADHYDEALSQLPVIRSSVVINKVEVWVTNKTGVTDNTRNIIGFIDLGEQDFDTSIQPGFIAPTNRELPSDSSNTLIDVLNGSPGFRDVFQASNLLAPYGPAFNYTSSKNWEKVENARKLTQNEFTYNANLGYISLNQALNSDEVLCVAFQYSINGRAFQVGNLSTDGVNAPSVLWVKMLKSTITNPRIFTWDLMMKNIYPLNAYSISPKDFMLEVLYQDDELGQKVNYLPKGCTDVQGVRLIKVLNLDKMNTNRDPRPDGVFDIVDGITINLNNGRVIFPVREPFGKFLQNKLYNPAGATCNSPSDQLIANKYCYFALYDSTKNSAQQQPEKNKFSLRGSYQGSSGSEIALNAVNVPQGSVTVTAGGILLKENVDYTVDYTLGRVKIINSGYLNSNVPLKVNLESNSLFAIQSKRLIGGRFDYVVNKDFNLGGTVMHLLERPLTQKVNIGDEPISNTIWGVDGSYRKESRFLTKMVDGLPLINTKEASNVTVVGEFADLMPGHASAIGSSGISYIDDFEAAITSIDIKNPGGWFLASTPQHQKLLFPEGELSDSIRYGFNRSRLAWYIVDPLFQQNINNLTPDNITDADMKNNFIREIPETEIFPNKSSQTPTAITCLNLAFYPDQRGPYNYDTLNVKSDGTFTNPDARWGGIMRRVETNDFEASNIGLIQFWMMDPFNEDNPNKSTTTGGELYFNLGDISEDVLRDSHKSFENGLKTSNNSYDMGQSNWGNYPKIQSIVNAFDNDEATRSQQDVGLDGFDDAGEANYFSAYINAMRAFGTSSPAYLNALKDPSSDDYSYFQSGTYNATDARPLARYKRYNGQEGNSPSPPTVDGYNATGTNLPDGEDVNRDNNMNETESYFQYRVRLDPQKMNVGENYISDKITSSIQGQPGKSVTWYQFKIPVRQPDAVINGIQDFKSIRFIRMFLKGWKDSVVCRFAKLEFQRTEWRSYEKKLLYSSEYIPSEYPGNTSFDVSGVSIVENGNKKPIAYVLPPNITRQVDPTTQTLVQLNEQSLSMKVCGLEDGDSRAAYKNMQLDIRRYGRIQMNIHAEGTGDYLDALKTGDLTAFIRIGSDFTENYYEYEIPLAFTNSGETDPYKVWPDANLLDLELDQLVNIKQQRNNIIAAGGWTLLRPYTYALPNGHIVRIVGSPNLSNVQAMMIGVRNPHKSTHSGDNGTALCGELWFDELRLTDFNEHGGWAANLRVTAKLADLGTVTLAGNHSTFGFGSIEQKINERSKTQTSGYDLSSNFELGKFIPQKAGIRIPFFFGYSETFINPEFNPMDPDVPFSTAMDESGNPDSVKHMVQDYTQRKSFNFTNVKKNKTGGGKSHLWDVENFTLNYAYTELYHHDVGTDYHVETDYRGGIGYNFGISPKNVTPFNKMRGKYLRFIKDFNFYYLPSSIAIRWDLNRSYSETHIRNISGLDFDMPSTFNKSFDFNRAYDLKFDLTKSLKFDFLSNAQARVDEPEGRIDTREKRDTMFQNILNMGRLATYHHSANLNYALPLNKFPILDWISASAKYGADYGWMAGPLVANQFTGEIEQSPNRNTVNNAQNLSFNGQFNMVSLYNKIAYLKKLNSAQPSKSQATSKPKPKPPPKPKTAADSVTYKAYLDSLKNASRPSILIPIANTIAKIAMSVKTVSFTYTETNAMSFPGFTPVPKFLGNSREDNGIYAPGFDFVSGFQKEQEYKRRFVENNWLGTDSALNAPFSRSNLKNFTGRATIEPFKSFKIELTANRNYSENHTEYFKYDPTQDRFQSFSPLESGNFSMSYLTWNTAFVKDNADYSNSTFTQFGIDRSVISQRLGVQNPNSAGLANTGFYDGYSGTQQQVLTYAFRSAYTGGSAANVKLDEFPSIPMPNWRITYDGLGRVSALQKIFSSVNLSHGYRSSYSVSAFSRNLLYGTTPDGKDASRDADTNFIPKFTYQQVSISEQFSPLIGIDVQFKNNVQTRFEVKNDRTVSLSFSNIQITEIRGVEYVFGLGYRIQKFKVPFKLFGNKPLNGNLDLKGDFSIRDNTTIIRQLEQGTNQPTAGTKILSVKLSADYAVNDRLTIRLFFDRIVNTPFVSLAYPTANTNAGFSIRFTLAQ